MKKKSMWLSFMLAAAMLVSGCGQGSAGDAPASSGSGEQNTKTVEETAEPSNATDQVQLDEPVADKDYVCRYVVPGTESDDSQMVDAAVTEKLKNDGLNMDFSRIYVPWDVWEQKTNVMMASGEAFELIHVMEDWIPSSNYVARGGIVPITGFVDQYGEFLKQRIPEMAWDAARIEGEIYTIPVYYRDFSRLTGSFYLPTLMFEKYGLSLNPESIYEYQDSLATIIKGEAAEADYRVMPKVNTTYDDVFLRAFDSYPFVVKEVMFMISYDGKVSSWLDSEEFKELCAYARRGYEMGVYHPDVLTIPMEVMNQQQELGNSLVTDPYGLNTIRKVKPDWTLTPWVPVPDKPLSRGEWIYMNGNSVSVTSPNPEAGVIFFNWLYSSQENSDLLNYGIEGTHWTDAGNRRYEPINLKEDGSRRYEFGDWEMSNYQLVRLLVTDPVEVEDIAFGMDENALTAPSGSFKFDSSQVDSEYSACMAEIQASVYPLKYGVISYDDGYDKMISAMRAAGYERVVEAFKQQFETWYAANYQ